MTQQKKWQSDVPSKCQLCGEPITDEFFDVLIRPFGRWGIVDKNCFDATMCRLGTGRGQHYRKQADGTFVKVQG